jgi:hypothetical protein
MTTAVAEEIAEAAANDHRGHLVAAANARRAPLVVAKDLLAHSAAGANALRAHLAKAVAVRPTAATAHSAVNREADRMKACDPIAVPAKAARSFARIDQVRRIVSAPPSDVLRVIRSAPISPVTDQVKVAV